MPVLLHERVLLALLLTVGVARGDFVLGKLHPAGFDLPELNGVYRPAEAADACDQHPTCAGFTYRGLLNFVEFPDRRYETFFVRFVDYIDDMAYFSNWVTYVTSKPFARYDGLFSGTFVPVATDPGSLVTPENVTKVCNLQVRIITSARRKNFLVFFFRCFFL